ncbi:MAG: hypothetical protein IPH22_10030, partial [Nitrosomonas sp.]|nr:hypothetical protein [Nitrosomonas sp.]
MSSSYLNMMLTLGLSRSRLNAIEQSFEAAAHAVFAIINNLEVVQPILLWLSNLKNPTSNWH